jgi:hypothetical protein
MIVCVLARVSVNVFVLCPLKWSLRGNRQLDPFQGERVVGNMWIVVVSAFAAPTTPTLEESKELSEFVANLRVALAETSKDVRIDCRSLAELGSIVYAPRWGLNDDKSVMAFDHIDMVFIRGCIGVLPWFKSAKLVGENCRIPATGHTRFRNSWCSL